MTSSRTLARAVPAGRRRRRRRRRGGSVILYTVVSLVALAGIVSLAVDYGHVQVVKAQMQRSAEAVARGYFDFQVNGQPVAYVSLLEGQACNPVDPGSGLNPTYTPVPGAWNPTTSTFTAGATGNGTTTFPAVQVTVARTGANGVRLFWGKVLGLSTCNVHATATAALLGGQSGQVDIPRNADPYLAGEPSGTTISGGWGDNTSTATPYGVSCITVVPGTYITMTNVSGTSSIYPGHVDTTGPDGDTSLILHHGENYDGNPDPPYPNPEHGVGDAKMPSDALMGLFLTDTAPDQTTAPAAADWTDAAHANQASYTDLQNQAPFLIGNGQTTGGTTQQFLVPPGATRLYLAVWDGVEYNNNSGGLSGTINVKQKVVIVQAQ